MKNKFFRKPTHQNFILFHFLFSIFTLLAIFNIFSPGIALAVDVKLQWDSNNQAAGYKLPYGIESRAYDFMIDVGSSLKYTVPDLNDSQLYYFAVTAYNEFGESDFSEEISYKPV
ncbi:MAG: fibronectin type III domain-containing protein, partial [Deltaproteobacteria bacterium]|nr:fibronectin type III domain-containing protein [Deltaproteobacteria bacterium]